MIFLHDLVTKYGKYSDQRSLAGTSTEGVSVVYRKTYNHEAKRTNIANILKYVCMSTVSVNNVLNTMTSFLNYTRLYLRPILSLFLM